MSVGLAAVNACRSVEGGGLAINPPLGIVKRKKASHWGAQCQVPRDNHHLHLEQCRTSASMLQPALVKHPRAIIYQFFAPNAPGHAAFLMNALLVFERAGSWLLCHSR